MAGAVSGTSIFTRTWFRTNDDGVALRFKDDVYVKYRAAREAYDKNFTDYKSASRFSDQKTIEQLISQTYDTTKLIAEAVKSTNNLIQFYQDKLTERNLKLIVGGIGIMNMMLTTVTERTREIGLRKAIGAKSRHISRQFLTEAVMLTFLGGIMGVVLGWILALAVSQFAGIATQVSLQAVLLAFGVSAAIGIIFGYYPARRAASLNPIEALRYE